MEYMKRRRGGDEKVTRIMGDEEEIKISRYCFDPPQESCFWFIDSIILQNL